MSLARSVVMSVGISWGGPGSGLVGFLWALRPSPGVMIRVLPLDLRAGSRLLTGESKRPLR
jgi:hypothetical protein